jgi:hypothetical protein
VEIREIREVRRNKSMTSEEVVGGRVREVVVRAGVDRVGVKGTFSSRGY